MSTINIKAKNCILSFKKTEYLLNESVQDTSASNNLSKYFLCDFVVGKNYKITLTTEDNSNLSGAIFTIEYNAAESGSTSIESKVENYSDMAVTHPSVLEFTFTASTLSSGSQGKYAHLLIANKASGYVPKTYKLKVQQLD